MNNFISSSKTPGKINPESYLFIFYKDQIVLKSENGQHTIQDYNSYALFEKNINEKYYIGTCDNIDCYAALLSEPVEVEHHEMLRLRKAYYTLPEENFWLAGRAFQIAFFHHNHLFCGVCGSPTEIKNDEFARICNNCKTTFYPQQAPAVIVAVTKGNKILLGRSSRFPTKMYSVLAGFVEPGESLEDCVEREVWEESGIKVKNIRYFGSQPWPFPNSLMVGFIAEYESGEIKIDDIELEDAGWYSYDQLPEIPDRVSIARKLIDWFVDQNKSRK